MHFPSALLFSCLACILFASSPTYAATAIQDEVVSTASKTPLSPGCVIQRALDVCLEDTGNGYEQLRCLQPALRDARAELADVHMRIAPRLREDTALLAAFAAAEASWQAWIERDCEVVSQDWSGGSMRRAVVAACHYRHTVERTQQLWGRHEQGYEGQVPADCLPDR
ncbi:MAG: lysozyme inhibitor LprI family protein [Pseudomarimonas sp.]